MIKSPYLAGFLCFRGGGIKPPYTFRYYLAARMVGGFASSCEAKAPLRQKLHPPPILGEPLPLLEWPH